MVVSLVVVSVVVVSVVVVSVVVSVAVSVGVGVIAVHEVTRRKMMGLLKRLSTSTVPVRW